MHWLGDAAARAGIKGASALLIPSGTNNTDAWEMGARALGTTPNDLASRLAPTFGLHAATFTTADAKAVRLVPEKLARKYNVFPVREDDRRIVVATSDPHNIECEQALAFGAGRRVVFELAPPYLVAQAINRPTTAVPWMRCSRTWTANSPMRCPWSKRASPKRWPPLLSRLPRS